MAPAHGQHLLLAAGQGATQLADALLDAGQHLEHFFHALLDQVLVLTVQPASSRFSRTVRVGKIFRPSARGEMPGPPAGAPEPR